MSAHSRFEFSSRTRAHNMARLKAESFDILIIGGGITGVGIAREAALRGYKVALLEKDDLASGTSSQSSKLIHGGVRYLEHFHFGLVYEASTERRRLLQLAPNHVWAMPFIYPIYRDNRYGPFLINLGLWMYDALALFRNVDRHRMLTTELVSKQLPSLDVSRVVAGARYYDAQTDDARLTLETARSAHLNGAVILNHVEVQELSRNIGKRVDGIRGRDTLTSESLRVNARVVVNATGPWTDILLQMDSPKAKPRLRPTKGVHLLVSRERFPVPTAVSFTVKADGRLMFVLPRDQFTLIGTTDTDQVGSPDDVCAEPSDVNYILAAVESEFPNVPLQRNDVISTFAGLRPLVSSGSSFHPGGVSREHAIWISPSGLVTIAGGKLTTYRSMASELVDRVAKILARDFRIHATRPSRTAQLPLIESQHGTATPSRGQIGVLESLSEETRQHLGRAYGSREGTVLDYVESNPDMGKPILDGFPYIWAEVPHSVQYEIALSLNDVMMRRLDLFHQVPDGAVGAATAVAGKMATLLGWQKADIEHEVNSYNLAVERNRRALRQR